MSADAKKIPGLVLREWAGPEAAGVLRVKLLLSVDCEIVRLEFEAAPGFEGQAATAAHKLGTLMGE